MTKPHQPLLTSMNLKLTMGCGLLSRKRSPKAALTVPSTGCSGLTVTAALVGLGSEHRLPAVKSQVKVMAGQWATKFAWYTTIYTYICVYTYLIYHHYSRSIITSSMLSIRTGSAYSVVKSAHGWTKKHFGSSGCSSSQGQRFQTNSCQCDYQLLDSETNNTAIWNQKLHSETKNQQYISNSCILKPKTINHTAILLSAILISSIPLTINEPSII